MTTRRKLPAPALTMRVMENDRPKAGFRHADDAIEYLNWQKQKYPDRDYWIACQGKYIFLPGKAGAMGAARKMHALDSH